MRLLSEAILLSREAPSVAAFPTLALELTTAVVRNDLAGWNEVDPERQYANAVVLPAMELSDVQRSTLAELVHEHPLITYHASTGDGSAMKISDFITSEEFHSRRLYRELFAGLGMEHQMSIGLPSVLPRLTAVALNRNDLADDFDERDRLMLNTLRPHLAQSYEQIRERERLQRSVGALGGALEDHGTHAIVLDPDPDEVTRGALVLLYRYFGRPGAHDAFPRASPGGWRDSAGAPGPPTATCRRRSRRLRRAWGTPASSFATCRPRRPRTRPCCSTSAPRPCAPVSWSGSGSRRARPRCSSSWAPARRTRCWRRSCTCRPRR